MNLGNIANTVKRVVVAGERKAYKHGPTAMVVVGVGCVVAGTVVAVKEAMTVNEEGEDVASEVYGYKDDCGKIDEVTPEDKKLDRVGKKIIETLKLAKKLFRRFLWAIVLEACGIALIFAGHHMVLVRLSTAGAMVSTLSENLNNLEERIKDKLPEDKANEILYDKKTETKETASDDGKVNVETKTVNEKYSKKLDDPYCIEISERTCPMVNFIDINRQRAWEDILCTVSRVNSYDIPNYGGITAYDFLKDLHYRMDLLSKDALAKSKVVGKYMHPATEPLANSYIDLRVSQADLNAWFNGDSDYLCIYPNWDGYVADKF